MGLEKEIVNNGPPIFTGEALDIRLPDMEYFEPTSNGKAIKRIKKMNIVSFPHWVYSVMINETPYDIKGEDLKVGMAIIVEGNLFPILEIKPQLFHGQEIMTFPLGRPQNEGEEIKRHEFVRQTYEDGRVEWTLKNTLQD